MEDLALSFEACNAYLVREAIEATAPPNETAPDARLRAATILGMFKGFEPVTALDSMIACQCVTLRFVLMAALRDLAVLSVDERTQARMRSTAAALSRTLHQWVAQGKSVRAGREKAGRALADSMARGEGHAAEAALAALASAAPEPPAPASATPACATPASATPASATPAPATPAAPAPAARTASAQPMAVPSPQAGHAKARLPGFTASAPALPGASCPAALHTAPARRSAMLASTALAHGATPAGLPTLGLAPPA